MASKGTLYLIPTPLNEDYQLSFESKKLLNNAIIKPDSLILVEELKPARKRWIKWGLDREIINRFISYSEHNQRNDALKIIKKIEQGSDAYLMSDGGLPAFCDPGEYLVSLCHDHKLRVSSGSFCNSPLLALALSGFCSSPFLFIGFLPKKENRQIQISKLAQSKITTIIMDTPYRLGRLLSELSKENKLQNRRAFLAMDLNMPSEECVRDNIIKLSKKDWGKREFILVLENLN